MSEERMASGMGGMMGALQSQFMATDLINRTLHPAQLNQPSSGASAQTQSTVLAKAVTGVGAKIDLKV